MKQQKGLLLISGGIDSPVAGYLMLKKAVDVSAIHFGKPEKVRALLQVLARKFSRKITLFSVDHNLFMKEISANCNRRYACVLCKRMMFRIAEAVANKNKIDFLITGCNLGQVASQTLDNMAVTSSAVKMIIIRPLLCNDKLETMNLAKQIGTYELSTVKSPGCPYVPDHPATKARQDIVEQEEARIDVNKLVEQALSSVVVEEIQ